MLCAFWSNQFNVLWFSRHTYAEWEWELANERILYDEPGASSNERRALKKQVAAKLLIVQLAWARIQHDSTLIFIYFTRRNETPIVSVLYLIERICNALSGWICCFKCSSTLADVSLYVFIAKLWNVLKMFFREFIVRRALKSTFTIRTRREKRRK